MAVIEVLEYNGAPVSFDLGDSTVFINATQMAKPFSKLPKDYLARQETKELVCAILAERGIPLLPESVDFREAPATDIVRVVHGGSNPGTWMHKDLALDFARWLAPEVPGETFEFWLSFLLDDKFHYIGHVRALDTAKQICNLLENH